MTKIRSAVAAALCRERGIFATRAAAIAATVLSASLATMSQPASAATSASPGAVCPTNYNGTKFGASVDDAEDWQRVSGLLGRNMCAARRFYKYALPQNLASDGVVASLPTNATVVFSWKSAMTAAQVTASLSSRPAGMVCYASYYHEPEENFPTAAQQSAYRASWGTYGPAIRAAGCKPVLILMRYTLNAGSGRDWHNWSNNSSYDVNGWDAYNPKWDQTPSGYTDPSTTIKPIQQVAAENGKRWLMTEAGSPIAIGSTSAARATWAGQLAVAYYQASALLALWWDSGAGTSFDNTLDQATASRWNATGAPR